MKEIPGFEGLYACEENGEVYSLARIIYKKNNFTQGRIVEWHLPLKKLSQCIRNDGYKGLSLRKDNKNKSYLVHRLIAMAFLGVTNEEINHKDGNKLNNTLKNLEITNRSLNIKHAFNTGLRTHKGKNHPRYYIDEKYEEKILKFLESGLTQQRIADILNIPQTAVSKIKLKYIKS